MKIVKCPKCHSENPDTKQFCADCGTRLSLREAVSVSVTKTLISPAAEGSVVAGRYKIIGKLGEGGMGVVYKAEDTRLKRTVALKFMPPELTRDAEAKERFIREAQAAAALSHPNICTIYEVDEEEGKSFISMEYVEGQSIREIIKRGPLDATEALGIAIQATQGLEEAHKKGIIHRDIKSANIMVTGSGQGKVMDFGLAKVFGASLITKEAKTMGTVAYMSPEQAQGQSVDHRTDIWSLCVVLYEMLTGQLPFKGEYDQSIIRSILSKEPEPLTKVSPNLPKGLENVVLTALAKNPATRYQSMGELLDDLRAIAEGLKPLRAKTGLLRGKLFGIKKAYAFPGLTALLFIIALGVIFLVINGGRVYDSVAILPLINDSGDPGQDYFANSLTDLLISELYKVAALNVASRQSVMPYKGSSTSPRKIADELRVKAIVEASVLTSGDRVRLTARLWDPYQQKTIWADTLEREYTEILILQSELCQKIVSGIRVAVTPAEKKRLVTEREVVRQAYDLFLKGLDSWGTGTKPSDRYWRSLDLFQKAIDVDLTLGVAHAWKAKMLLQLGANGYADEKEVYPKAKEAAQEALKIDPGLSVAHSVLGSIMCAMDWDFLGAEMETKKAAEIDPGNHVANNVYLQVLLISGKSNVAIEWMNRWISRGEKDISKREYPQSYTDLFFLAGYFKEALELQKKIMDRHHDSTPRDVSLLAKAYAMNDMNYEALAQIEKIKDHPVLKEDVQIQRNYACILGRCGRHEEAMEKLEEIRVFLIKKNTDPAFYTACVYANIGNKDQAFEYLNQAYKNHSTMMVYLISMEWLRSLHGDSRFEELARKVGFPEVSQAISKSS